MKRSVQPFTVPAMLAVSFGLVVGQGDTLSSLAPAPLSWTSVQGLAPKAPTPAPRVTRRPNLPSIPAPQRPGDAIPHSYLVFGLRTGPGSMAFTDQNGAVIPVPSNARIFLNPPLNGAPAAPPPTSVPRYTFPRTVSPPAPKK